MKKRIICLLAALLLPARAERLSASAAVYANVIDTAELLSESEAEALDARCSELEQTYGCGVYLMTVDDYTAYYSADSIESFAESVFLDLGLGAGRSRTASCSCSAWPSGITISAPTARSATAPLQTTARACSPSAGSSSAFSRDDWSGGFAAFLDGCEEYLRMDAEGARPSTRAPTRSGWGDLAVVKSGWS